MQSFKSRDQVFTIYLPDNACKVSMVDATIVANEGYENDCSLRDLAFAISRDCFSFETFTSMNVHAKIGDREYKFKVTMQDSIREYLLELASQIKL